MNEEHKSVNFSSGTCSKRSLERFQKTLSIFWALKELWVYFEPRSTKILISGCSGERGEGRRLWWLVEPRIRYDHGIFHIIIYFNKNYIISGLQRIHAVDDVVEGHEIWCQLAGAGDGWGENQGKPFLAHNVTVKFHYNKSSNLRIPTFEKSLWLYIAKNFRSLEIILLQPGLAMTSSLRIPRRMEPRSQMK